MASGHIGGARLDRLFKVASLTWFLWKGIGMDSIIVKTVEPSSLFVSGTFLRLHRVRFRRGRGRDRCCRRGCRRGGEDIGLIFSEPSTSLPLTRFIEMSLPRALVDNTYE